MMKKNLGYDTHHIIPKSRGGSDKNINIIKLKVSKHRALHQLFGNHTPLEQLIDILSINSKVLKEEFKKELYELLSVDIDDIYKDEALIYKEKTKQKKLFI